MMRSVLRREIVRRVIVPRRVLEHLDCGHVLDATKLLPRIQTRVCSLCGRSKQSLAASERKKRRELLTALLATRREWEERA